jgi:hypothetical protein
LYVEGYKNGANHDITAAWPGDLITPDSDGFYYFTYNNSGYEWVNGKLNDSPEAHNNLLYRGSSDDIKDGNAFWLLYEDDGWKTPQKYWPQARNTNEGAPQQPATVYLGDSGLSFGCDSWGTANGKWTKWRVWISKTQDLKAGSSTEYQSDRNENDYSDNEQKTATSPQFTATGVWYWGIQVDYSNEPVAWYAQATTGWTDMITAGELASKANLTVNVLPLNDPTGLNAQLAGEGVDLSWTKNAQTHDVMIVRIPSAQSFTEPVQGTEYTVNETIGNGKIVYLGNAESWNDNAEMAAATGYIYKFYSVNHNYYSAGTVTNEVVTPGSTASDHFRSNGSGAWNEIAWQSSSDNEHWIDASLVPTGSAASITIREGNTVAYTGNLALSGNFYLSKNAEFTATGTFTASRIYVKVKVEAADRWYFIGFPFAITGITGTTVSGDPFAKGTHYDLAAYNEATRANHASGWEYVVNLPLSAGKGYAFWAGSDVKDLDLTFEVSPANISDAVKATAATSLSYTTGTGLDSDKGWNFIAHPITSSASVALGADSGNFLYTYNPVDGSYSTSEGTVNGLHPFDAYFIKTAETSNKNLSFSNQLQESQSVVGAEENLTLYLGNHDSPYRSIVRTKTQSTGGYDDLYDAPHLMPMLPQTPQIYTLIQTEKMAINSVPGAADVALGIRVPAAGNYTISWDNRMAEKSVRLKDNAGGTVNMQEQSSYTFTTSAGDEINSRFTIQLAPTGIAQTGNETLKVYSTPGQIVVEGLSGRSDIRLYDLLGKRIHQEFTLDKSCRINVPNKGVYIIEANSTKVKVVCR